MDIRLKVRSDNPKSKSMKVTYISNPKMVKAQNASEFRALVQKYTGRGSDKKEVAGPMKITGDATDEVTDSETLNLKTVDNGVVAHDELWKMLSSNEISGIMSSMEMLDHFN